MKYLVVGDLHGNWKIAEKALAHEYLTVFVGDYFDSFTASPEDCVRTFRIVTDAAVNKQAIPLIGNHDYHYFGDGCFSSGYNHNTQLYADTMRMDISGNGMFKYHIEIEGFLITHAGLSANFFGGEATREDVDTYLYTGDYLQVGPARGGYFPCGGILWCDYEREFKAIPGVKQIFGHSAGTEIRTRDKENYCIDCVGSDNGVHVPYGLLIEDGKAEPFLIV